MRYYFHLVIITAIFTITGNLFAIEPNLSVDFESYLGRPDALHAKPIFHPELPKDWFDFRNGLLDASAFFSRNVS